MSERNYGYKMTAAPKATGSFSCAKLDVKKRAPAKKRRTVTLDEAIEIILTEDAPLLERLAQ